MMLGLSEMAPLILGLTGCLCCFVVFLALVGGAVYFMRRSAAEADGTSPEEASAPVAVETPAPPPASESPSVSAAPSPLPRASGSTIIAFDDEDEDDEE
jgi:hypothetical protein